MLSNEFCAKCIYWTFLDAKAVVMIPTKKRNKTWIINKFSESIYVQTSLVI